MMNQAEIYDMQNYCIRRNHEMDERDERKDISVAGMILLIMGALLSLMSICLVIYVMWASVAMTGWMFMATGIAGLAGGIVAMILSKIVR